MNKDNLPERDNPLVAVTLRFKDGVGLRQVFTTPVPQAKAMAALGRMVAELGAGLKIELEERKCRVCGCTETAACMTESGPCYWVEPDLCSACAREKTPGE